MVHQPLNEQPDFRVPERQPYKSLVVLSGGQDSATCAAMAVAASNVVGAVHFQYGQRHSIEEQCARTIAAHLDIPLHVLPIDTFSAIGDSALLSKESAISAQHARLRDLPASFVPGRNLAFLVFAAALAMKLGATRLWLGVCMTDYSGYPDCRAEAMAAMQVALRTGMDFPELEIVTPLMYLTKGQTFAMADHHEVLELVLEHTMTCYEGNQENRYEWGYGCGECPACKLRRKGWQDFQQMRQV